MAHLRKQGRNYYADFYDPERKPNRKWVPLRTRDKVAANSRMVKLDRQYANGDFDPWIDSTQVRVGLEAVAKQFADSRRGHCVPKTVANYEHVLDLFSRSMTPGVALHSVGLDDVREFLTNPDWSNATIHNYYRHLRAFFRWAIEESKLKSSPLKGLRLPKREKKVAPYLTIEQLEHLLTTMRAHFDSNVYRGSDKSLWLPDLVEFACYTGLRRSELERLRWRDIDLDSGHLTVRNDESGATKSGAERRVPVVSRAEEILITLRVERNPAPTDFVFTSGGGRQLDGHYVSKRFRRYRKLAELPDEICFHSCRHTFASWMVMKDISLLKVKEVLGHSSIEVTQRYAHLAPGSMRDDMRRAFE